MVVLTQGGKGDGKAGSSKVMLVMYWKVGWTVGIW